jgi:hypothetical protein
MPGILRGIQPGPVCQLLYDARHVNARQPVRLHLPMSID